MAVQMLERRARAVTGRREASRLAALRHLDLTLVAAALALAAIGVVMVYSATNAIYGGYYLKHQLIYAVLGIVVMVVLMSFDYRRLEEWAVFIYGFSVLTLLAVRAVGHTSNLGATREIVLGPLAIQPSEFGVLSVIVASAVFLHRHDTELGVANLARLGGLVAVPMALVAAEPDLGTTIVTAVVVATMLVVGGVRLRYLALVVLGLVSLVLIGTKVHLLHSYQLQRLTAFLHQSDCNQPKFAGTQACYQPLFAQTAIGAGGVSGTGLFHGALTNSNYIPEDWTDMIFSTIGEQFGFVGSVVVVGLFGVIALRMVRAMQVARDTLGRLLCGGALAFVAFSVFQNVGMNAGLMPITGIPLPFISYGGSALFATFAVVGLVANVEMRRFRSR
ncbi:MAG TPA: FtsW/RodA/SpoVE family cell cycle protein [Acidimicrobiales bacterium]|nr:FtsW/RodA/SpoVE family cell cycle protein [Acidimicrobiales bacterium]